MRGMARCPRGKPASVRAVEDITARRATPARWPARGRQCFGTNQKLRTCRGGHICSIEKSNHTGREVLRARVFFSFTRRGPRRRACVAWRSVAFGFACACESSACVGVRLQSTCVAEMQPLHSSSGNNDKHNSYDKQLHQQCAVRTP